VTVGEGRIRSFSFPSKVLAGNPLGDPVTRSVWTWEPPGEPPGPLPLLLGLTGFTGTGSMLFHDSPWSPGLGRRLDRLYAEGNIPPLVVALPDCFTRYGGSQYVNSTATGRYADYVCTEILREVEARYPVHRDREHRAVYGKSSGGFGAIRLAMERSDLFGAAACQSGDMAFEYCYLPDFPHTVGQLRTHGGLDGFLRAFDEAPRKTDDLIKAMNIVAMSACYSPDPERPDRPLFPFEVPSGRIREEVWHRWLAHDPVRRVGNHLDALRSLRTLFLDCGARDEFNLQFGARMLHEALDAADVPHVYEEFDDGHRNISYRYERAITVLGRAMG